MDPEVIFFGAVLAILGARKRAATGGGPTPGERVERATVDSSNRIGGTVAGVVQAPAAVTAGTVAKATAVPGTGLLANAIATGGRVGASLVQAGVSATSQIVARPTGLVVDGAAAVADLAAPLFKRSHPKDGKGSPAKRTSAKKRA